MGRVEERRARVTDAIVAAATEVMAEGGAASLSLGEVARRMRMRTPSLYGYFGSRGELCDEIFRRGWDDYGRLSAVTVTADTDFPDLLRRALLESVTWANEHRAAAELMFWRPIPHWQPSAAAFGPAIAAMDNLVRVVAEAQAAGHVRDDVAADEVAQVLATLTVGVIGQQLANEPGVPAGEGRASRHAESFASMFLKEYGTMRRTT